MLSILNNYSSQLKQELHNILHYWMEHTPDELNGGFVGRINNNNEVDHEASKGAVLNARILWSFSAAYNLESRAEYLTNATRAYGYIIKYFVDKQYGGVYWTLDHKGNPLDTKKQVYAIAFTIYALSEYFIACGDGQARQLAIQLYRDLVKNSYDKTRGGYYEAFARDWGLLEDLRLSDKDENEKKTMNTHLHVLEAYTTLYKIWPDQELNSRIRALLFNFLDHLIDQETNHLILFFDEGWNRKSGIVSYGHDIEASWLLLEAAIAIQDNDLIKKLEHLAVKIADGTIMGLDKDGGLWYESDPMNHHIVTEKHWWVQAEAMVGFFNAFQISGDIKYLNISLANWRFIQDKIIDPTYGEWFWGIGEDGRLMIGEDKVGLWKCPYHNSRACIELIRRIKAMGS